MCRKHGKTLLGKCFIYPVESRLDLYVAKPVRGKYTDWQNAGYGLPGAQKLLHGTGTEDRKTPCVYTRIHRMRSCRRELGLLYTGRSSSPCFGIPPIRCHIIYSMDSIRKLWSEFGGRTDEPGNGNPGRALALFSCRDHSGKKSGNGLRKHLISMLLKISCMVKASVDFHSGG